MKPTAMLAVLVLILAPSALLGQNYYLGNVDTECATCHGPLVTSYLNTGHATAFDDIEFGTRPLYYGNPWFLSPMIAWYRWRDRRGF